MSPNSKRTEFIPFDSAEMGALAHLYRGELYRSKIWRTRLDTTTNWAVATTGIALSVTFSGADISELPLLLIGLLVTVFLLIEARRYRYFDMWRNRVRIMETNFFGPILQRIPISIESGWNEALRHDYRILRFHIGYREAIGRRLRRNYLWIFGVLIVSYLAKLSIHPVAASDFWVILERASIGPIPGWLVLGVVAGYGVTLVGVALATLGYVAAAGRVDTSSTSLPRHL